MTKSYPPMAGQYTLPVYAFALFGPKNCSTVPYCDDIPIQFHPSSAPGVVASGVLITLTWQGYPANRMYLWLYDDEGGAISRDLPNKESQTVKVLALDEGIYHAEPINGRGPNLGYTLTFELLLQVLPDAPYLRPSDPGFGAALEGAGAKAGRGSISFIPSAATRIDDSATALVPDGKVKVPGADGVSGEQPLTVLTRGQKGTVRQTVIGPVLFGLAVVMLSAAGAFAYARVRARRAPA